ncbi:DUF4476 domain-containing protein [Chryseobacterium sp. MHB01]|uniref:DUF4476 domain-containing protein n=1 Tax=Chryseobacterium TaxID=59732 RepID=UPI002AFE2975|nr:MULTISPECIES: DUF4476 domain-containing protein [Chryseobacterium]MEA1850688.1 DUF4476 domain-containing protein [Chryseobacterium sp. MHB01]MEC5174317.1 hypothetical protein [Chryseobacterium nepalense]
MKSICISVLLLFAVTSFAQEAGKAGELLKNEASKTEIGSVNNKKSGVNGKNNPGFRNQGNSGFRTNSPQYRWNQEYGYSEVFLRIPEQGFFSVEIGDQFISNNSGKFRFFDLPAGRIPISIYESGYLLYRTTLNVRNNSRLVLDFFTNEGLFLLDSYPVQSYGFNSWNDIWNNPYGNSGNINYPNVMDNQTFQQFMDTMKDRAWFDDKKLAFINQQGRHAMFTSEQISMLVKDLSFDKNKLALAKSLFPKCVDKQKYFIVGEALDFESSRKELMDYISKL